MDLKLLASQGFSRIDGIIELKKLFTRPDIRKMVAQATKALDIIMISPATSAVS